MMGFVAPVKNPRWRFGRSGDRVPTPAWALVVVLVVGGCQKKASETATRPTTQEVFGEIPADVLAVRPALPTAPAPATRASRLPNDPAPAVAAAADAEHVLGLDTYLISVPVGVVSRDENFWKRVDEEEGIDAQRSRILKANGIRVGQAKLEDWPFFKDIIDQRPATTQLYNFVSIGGKTLELEMRKDIPVEHVWTVNPGQERGRTYDDCQNLWTVAYQAVPRSPEKTRVTMSPLIRCQRKRLEVITHRAHPEDPPDQEIAYVSPEYPLDVGIEAEIQPAGFLVVAPTADVAGGSVGEAFLTADAPGQRVEKVLLMVPRMVAATFRAPRGK